MWKFKVVRAIIGTARNICSSLTLLYSNNKSFIKAILIKYFLMPAMLARGLIILKCSCIGFMNS